MNAEQQYLDFYQSVKSFILKTYLTYENEIEGEKLSVIQAFENKCSVKLPISILYYLLFFGKKILVRKTEPEDFFTLEYIKKAMEVAEKYNYRNILGNKEGLQDYNGDDGDIKLVYEFVDLDKLIFINQSGFRDGIGFVDSTKDNPYVHYLFQKQYYLGENKSFTNFIRELLFLAIQTKIYDSEKNIQFDSAGVIDSNMLFIEDISWAQLYVDYKVKNVMFDSLFRMRRLEFYDSITEQENRGAGIMLIDEFEWAFINYLRTKGYKL